MDTYKYPHEVAWEIDQNDEEELIKFSDHVNTDETIQGIIIQHEYGIFGGEYGEKLLSFMQRCKKPMLVTLHTMLPHPNQKMAEITEKIIYYATSIVVLTLNSKQIIEATYPQAIGKTSIVPHGIHPTTFSDSKKIKTKLELGNRIVLSTFGLLSRGKGIEFMIRSLPDVIKKYPSLLYLILGETHPVVRRNEGEKYRLELEELVTSLGLSSHVRFFDQYLSLPDLHEFLKATDIYISTSINPDQAVSGTLSYALGSGRAVISTDFAQAKEIITPETGRLVPTKDAEAFTQAILELLDDENKLEGMRQNAYKKTRNMLWSSVSERYIALLTRTVVPLMNMDHLYTMTDAFGMLQFASLTTPNKEFGYTLDDNARALIVCSWLIKKNYSKKLETLIGIYLLFIKKCQQTDGSFVNYLSSIDQKPTHQNNTEDLQDVQGRALWALSEIINNSSLSREVTTEAKRMYILALENLAVAPLHHLRAKALAIKSFSISLDNLLSHRDLLLSYTRIYADSLLLALANNSTKDWVWFENQLSYNNAILADSLFATSSITKLPHYADKGALALNFLIKKTFSGDTYIPIGHSDWYKNGLKRSYYDQQPEDPASMILALHSAYRLSGNNTYRDRAYVCFSWYLGNNTLQKRLYDDTTGGCFDGLHPDRVNQNEGAESLVSYMMSSFIVNNLL